MRNPKLIVVSGPSGCGKTTIARELLRRHPDMLFSVSATTRSKRAAETDGVDYFFITREAFEEKLARNELAEWERIYDDYYGTPVSEINNALNTGRSIVLDIDVNGALAIRKKYGSNSLLIFIKPPSLDVLRRRLMNRKTESEEALRKRMERVAMELERAKEFDHTIVNDELAEAVRQADEIVLQAAGAPA